MIIPKSIFSAKNIFRLRVACFCIFELILLFEMLLINLFLNCLKGIFLSNQIFLLLLTPLYGVDK